MTALATLVVCFGPPATAQQGPLWAPHVPYVTTSPEAAEVMLKLAGVTSADTVYDLGCGDGRIVILAARKFGARGVGIDIDPERIEEANRNARSAGVTDRVRFILGDVFDADLRGASVVSMFLLPGLNIRLRPKLLRELKVGSRIVTHDFDFGDWKPERAVTVGSTPVFLWTVPATSLLEGRLLLEDGTPPPISASIERICGSKTVFEGYTDFQGRFTLALEATERARKDCRIRASLPGYRSDPAILDAFPLDIVLRRTSSHEGTLISRSARSAPSEARNAFDRGRKLVAEGRREEARNAFGTAVRLYPRFAMAWFELAALDDARGLPDEAAREYRQAIEADPVFISPYLRLANAAIHRNQWDQAAEYAARVIALDPENFPDAYLIHAVGSITQRRFDAAETSARNAMRLDTSGEFPRAEYVLGLALLARGDEAGARRHLTHYLEIDPKAPDAAQIRDRIAALSRR